MNRKTLFLIHRMVEFVVKEGPLFEAMIMNKELGNPAYIFLFENKSPDHIYYRWKLFSVLQGDSVKNWSMKPFRMYKTGSIWLPPKVLDYSKGMPEELIKNDINANASDKQYQKFLSLIRNLSLSRNSIAEAMIFCLNSFSVINSLIRILIEALTNEGTNPVSKIARLYLLSDILSNCINNGIKFDLPNMKNLLDNLIVSFNNLSKEIDKQIFRNKVSTVLMHWNSLDLLNDLKNEYDIFFNISNTSKEDDNSSSDEPLDGANLLKRSLKINENDCVFTIDSKNSKRICNGTINASKQSAELQQYFIPSKWDDIDPEQIQSESMTCNQMYDLELRNSPRIKREEKFDNSKNKKKKYKRQKRGKEIH